LNIIAGSCPLFVSVGSAYFQGLPGLLLFIEERLALAGTVVGGDF